MKLLPLLMIAPFLVQAIGALSHSGAPREAASPTPVIVELFTSEGCSSCPPADARLRELAQRQPIDGAEVIPLAFHVDYWDHLGWKDPFASKAFTDRQRAYAAAPGEGSLYTPQMVVNGREAFLGSDRAKAKRAIEAAAAARQPAARVEVTLTKRDAQPAPLVARIAVPTEGVHGDLMLAITENGLETAVPRGENAGRKLRHDAVVRTLQKVAAVTDQREPRFETDVSLELDERWDRRHLRAVVFIQDPDTRRITAAGAARIGD